MVPADAVLTPRDAEMPAWDSLSENSKRLFAHQMEVYAGYSENADHHVGRLLAAIEEMGELDNTVVIWIWGDNGASLAGTRTGTFNEGTMVNGLPLTDEEQMQLALKWGGLEAWGTEMMYPHYPTAWAWAGNTPFRWGKKVASHLGGTRNPLVIRWPERIKDSGGLRSQFTHVTDVGPTILDIAGIPQPTHVDGVEQQPMTGVSFTGSLADPDAPERHTQQYFENFGNRAMYKDGWRLSMRMPRTPWRLDPELRRRHYRGGIGTLTLASSLAQRPVSAMVSRAGQRTPGDRRRRSWVRAPPAPPAVLLAVSAVPWTDVGGAIHPAVIAVRSRRGLRDVRVFGSVARGDAVETSDVDLLVAPGPDTTLFDLSGFALEVEEIVGRHVDVATPRGLKARIRDRVLAEAVAL